MESDKLPCCELGSRAVLAKGAVAAVPEAGQWLLLVECQGQQEQLYRAAAAGGDFGAAALGSRAGAGM